jgi:hypothetical protein
MAGGMGEYAHPWPGDVASHGHGYMPMPHETEAFLYSGDMIIALMSLTKWPGSALPPTMVGS